jgi:DNA-binding transcriptional LysR family regulator
MFDSQDLELFVQLQRTGQLSSAAQELGLSPATITRRVSELEKRLGVMLLHRSKRGFLFTEAGSAFAARAPLMLAEMEQLHAMLVGSTDPFSGLLRVQSSLGFGRQLVSQWITKYQRLHPGLRIQLDVAVDVPGLPEQFDVALRVGEPPERDLIARRLASNERWLVASPDYLSEMGTPKTVQDLSSHRCLVLRQDQEAYSLWKLSKGRETVRVKVRPSLSSNHGEVIRAWAIEGLGIALRSAFDVAAAMRQKQLVRVLAPYQGPPGDIYALFTPQQRTTPKVRQFVQFLVQEIKLEKSWGSTPASLTR